MQRTTAMQLLLIGSLFNVMSGLALVTKPQLRYLYPMLHSETGLRYEAQNVMLNTQRFPSEVGSTPKKDLNTYRISYQLNFRLLFCSGIKILIL